MWMFWALIDSCLKAYSRFSLLVLCMSLSKCVAVFVTYVVHLENSDISCNVLDGIQCMMLKCHDHPLHCVTKSLYLLSVSLECYLCSKTFTCDLYLSV